METYPQNVVEQYLKASIKLKKIDRAVFKRFAPNVAEILEEFSRLALVLREAGLAEYAAMCYLGVAKCEMYMGNMVCECQAYMKAARSFLKGKNEEGSLRCYNNALIRCPDDSVFKAAVIRELSELQPHYEGGTSNFASLAHRIYELELTADLQLQRHDFFAALQSLDDIVDNIGELKRQHLYEELMRRVEILQLLLLVALNLPPARQSPAHIKLIEYYQSLGNFEILPFDDKSSSVKSAKMLKYALAEVVVAWCESNMEGLQLALEHLATKFTLNAEQQSLIKYIQRKVY